MAVAVGAACDFLTPIGHQCNTLVMGPGGYRFGDYWRLGLPLSLIVVAVGVPLIAIVWPLAPATRLRHWTVDSNSRLLSVPASGSRGQPTSRGLGGRSRNNQPPAAEMKRCTNMRLRSFASVPRGTAHGRLALHRSGCARVCADRSTNPLAPVDTSSPRATFTSFRNDVEQAYRSWRLRENVGQTRALAERVLRTLT